MSKDHADKVDTILLFSPGKLDTGSDAKQLPVAHISDPIFICGNMSSISVSHNLGDTYSG